MLFINLLAIRRSFWSQSQTLLDIFSRLFRTFRNEVEKKTPRRVKKDPNKNKNDFSRNVELNLEVISMLKLIVNENSYFFSYTKVNVEISS